MRTYFLRVREVSDDSDNASAPAWSVELVERGATSPTASATIPASLTLADNAERVALARDPLEDPDDGSIPDVSGWSVDKMLAAFDSSEDTKRTRLAIGRHLHSTLFADQALRDAFYGLAGAETNRVLFDLEPEALRRLPWELLSRGPQDYDLRTFLDPRLPLAYWTPVPQRMASAVELDWPLRLLVAVLSPPNDGRVQAERELLALEDRLHDFRADIEVLRLEQPGTARLIAELKRFKPHALHIIGHGTVNNLGETALLVSDNTGNYTRWTTASIANALQGAGPPRFVFLNVCHAGNLRSGHVSAVSQVFLKAGALAVLAARSELNSDRAVRFSRALLEHLAGAREPLDRAVANARRCIARDGELQARDWSSLSLMLQELPEDILTIGWGSNRKVKARAATTPKQKTPTATKAPRALIVDNDAQLRADLNACQYLAPLRYFVAREQKSWESWLQLSSAPPTITAQDTGRPRLFFVEGPHGVGKTLFTLRSLYRCALHGETVRYVDASSPTETTLLNLLGHIRDFSPPDAINRKVTGPLPTAPFEAFAKKAWSYADEEAPASIGRELPASLPHERLYREHQQELIELFRTGLAEVANQRGSLIVVLDHISDLPEELFIGALNEHLFRWCLTRGETAPPLRVVILTESAALARFHFDRLLTTPGVQRLQLPPFGQQNYVKFTLEFARRYLREQMRGFNGAADVPPIDEKRLGDFLAIMKQILVLQQPDESWSPKDFRSFHRTVENVSKRVWGGSQ